VADDASKGHWILIRSLYVKARCESMFNDSLLGVGIGPEVASGHTAEVPVPEVAFGHTTEVASGLAEVGLEVASGHTAEEPDPEVASDRTIAEGPDLEVDTNPREVTRRTTATMAASDLEEHHKPVAAIAS